MTIQLNPEQEQVISEAIQAGLIRLPSEVVELGIATVRQQLRTRPSSAQSANSEQWSKGLSAWMDGHATDEPLLSDEALDRDSIYGTRGL